jgi:hypothetical protein
MSAATKKGSLKRTAPDLAAFKAAQCADVFVREGRVRKESQKAYELAKCGLLDWLGDADTKNLPDGRVVSQMHADFPEATINRKAYIATTVTVGPPPAAE